MSASDWQRRAVCRDTLDDRFHSDSKREQDAVIAQYCNRCVVAAECFLAAVATEGASPYGIWGGLTADERKALRRRQQRAALAATA